MGDLSPEAGTLRIREGEGRRARHDHLGEEALTFVRSVAAGRGRRQRALLPVDGTP